MMGKDIEKKKMTISILLMLSMIIVSISALAIILVSKNKVDLQNTLERLRVSSDHYGELVDSKIGESLEKVQAITSFMSKDLSQKDIAEKLIQQEKDNRFVQMYYINKDLQGVKVYSNNEIVYNMKFENDKFIQRIFQGVYLSRDYYDQDLKKDMICHGVPVYDQDELIGIVLALEDLESFEDVLEYPSLADDGIVRLVNKDGRILMDEENMYVGDQLGESLGMDEQVSDKLEKFVKKEKSGLFQYQNDKVFMASHYLKDSQLYAVCIVPLMSVSGNFDDFTYMTMFFIVFVVFVFGGMTLYMNHKVYKGKEEVNYLAYYNPITKAYNKNGFNDLVFKVLNKDTKCSLVVLDIHDFKFINHTFGFQVGNQLLCYVVDVLKKNLGPKELYYHHESDQFGFLLYTQDKEEIKTRVMTIMDEVSKHHLFPNQRFPIYCYCGIKVINMFSENIDIAVMIDRAMIAKASVATLHGNHYAFYDEDMYKEAQRINDIEKRMNFALENEEFVMYIQPKYDLKKDKFCGGEALIRWQTKDGQMISPGEFIPIFEQNGFISYVDMYMLEKVCQYIYEMKKQGIDVLPISLNQSKISIFEKNYIERVRQILCKYNIEPGDVIIEITEGVSVRDIYEIENIVSDIKKLGLSISMDDFGSGYSSLNVLKELPIDELKLDRAFLMDTKYKDKSEIIMKNIITLAKECHMVVVCEGVETIKNVEMLKEMNCDIAQGYYYSKPLPLEEFTRKTSLCK